MNLSSTLRTISCVIFLIVPIGWAAPALSQSGQRIAAIVNNDIISIQDLTSRVNLAVIFSGLPNDEATRRRLAPQVMRRMIDEHLQTQEADRLNLVAGDPEVQQAMGRLAQPNGMTADQLMEFLAQRGIDPERLRTQVRAELSWVRLVRRTLTPRAVVSEQQVDLALDAEDEAGEQELLLSEILLPVYDATRLDEVVGQAAEMMAAIREGADFEALARQVSVGSTADAGGDLGWVEINSLAGVLRAAVANLQPGQLSDPTRSPAGIHLFLLRDRREGRSISSDPEARRLAQIFFPLPETASADSIELARTQANALRGRLASCEDVVAMADQLNAPGSGDLGWLRPSELPTDLAGLIASLADEQISEPIRSKTGIHLMMVCARGGDRQDERRREQVRSKLERAQVQRLANRYLRDLRKDAFIDVRVEL